MSEVNIESFSNLKQHTIKGINWNFLRVSIQVVISTVIGVVLARLLLPEVFGLLGIAILFIGLADLIATLGMGPAIVQRRNLTDIHIRVAFTVSAILGVTMICLFYLLANPISIFFDDTSISPIIRVVSLSFLPSGILTTSNSLLIRELRFKMLFYIFFFSYLFGYIAFAVPMAYLGFGVWSLVAGNLIEKTISCSISLYVTRPGFKPSLSKKEAIDLISFGGGVSLEGVLNHIANRVDLFTISKFLSTKDLGLYSRAHSLMIRPMGMFVRTLSSVLFPAYSKIQNDTVKISNAYFKTVNVTALLTFPVLIGMIVCARYIILGLYGSNWEGAIAPFRILCAAGLFKVIYHHASPVARVTGNIYSLVYRQFIYLIVILGASFVGLFYGIEGISAAVLLGSFWLYISTTAMTLGALKANWFIFIKAQIPGITVSSIVMIVDVVFIVFLEFIALDLILFNLLILFTVSGLSFVLALIYLPQSIKGEMPAWLFEIYGTYLPTPIRGWIFRRI